MKIDFVTEVLDQYVRERSVNPDTEARIIDIDGITNIFSIRSDAALYLTKENESGQKARFDRYKLVEHVTSFAAEKVDEQTIAVAFIADGNIYITFTAKPEELKCDSFRKMNFDNALGGIHLVPYRVIMTSMGSQVTLFAEFHDDAGFTQQFSAILTDDRDVGTEYFRLPSEFTDVAGIAAGRAARQLVDGTYTYGVFRAGNDSPYAGYVTEAPQLIYTPCCNLFGSTLPSPIRLKTEGNLEAICTQKGTEKTKGNTHLFAAGEGKLYFYPYQEQYDYLQRSGKGVPQVVAESNRLLNAKQIASYLLSDRLYIFVRTSGGELNYTVADYHDNTPGTFLEPVNFMDHVAGFDVSDGKITILTNDKFIECTQDPVTGAFKMDSISVDTDLDTHICFSAYSTRINVCTAGTEVTIASKSGEKIGFYANDCYYKTRKAVVEADNMGYVTIVQKADDISPDCYTVTCGEETIEINPAQQVQTKLLSMTNESDFKNAVITDPFGNTSPLVPQTKQSSMAAAAAGMAALRNASAGLVPGYNNPITQFENGVVMTIVDKAISILPSSVTENPFTQFVAKAVNDITAGFRWVIDKVKSLYNNTVGKAVTLVVQKTQKVWKFFAEIGGKVIHIVLDCAAKIMEGIKNILEIIGIPVDKIIDFFKKALGLDSAAKINAAIKNMVDISLDVLLDKASEMKENSIDFLAAVIREVEQLTGIDENSLSGISLPDPTAQNNSLPGDMGISLDSHNMYFFDLVKNSITDDIIMPEMNISGTLESAVLKLLDDIGEMEEDIEKIPKSLYYIANEVEGLLCDFNASNFLTVVKRILGVVAEDFLSISKTILKIIFDIIIEGIRSVWQALKTPIQIPFLSDVFSIFGIKEIAFVDLMTYPTAFLAAGLNSTAKLVSGQELFDIDAMEELSRVKNISGLRQMGGTSYE